MCAADWEAHGWNEVKEGLVSTRSPVCSTMKMKLAGVRFFARSHSNQLGFIVPNFALIPGLLLVAGCRVEQFKIETRTGSISTLRTTGDVVIRGGEVQRMAPGSVIRLSEKTFGKTRTAEIRERKGVPEF